MFFVVNKYGQQINQAVLLVETFFCVCPTNFLGDDETQLIRYTGARQ